MVVLGRPRLLVATSSAAITGVLTATAAVVATGRREAGSAEGMELDARKCCWASRLGQLNPSPRTMARPTLITYPKHLRALCRKSCDSERLFRVAQNNFS